MGASCKVHSETCNCNQAIDHKAGTAEGVDKRYLRVKYLCSFDLQLC